MKENDYVSLKTTSIYEKKIALDIYKNIIDVLTLNKAILWSWGGMEFRCVELEGMVGVVFTVNGFLYKGLILVLYDEGRDCYRVSKANVKNGAIHALKSMLNDEIYFDDLVQYIDVWVETGGDDENYREMVESIYKNYMI